MSNPDIAIEAYAQMQAQLVSLLLRHEDQRFTAYFNIHQQFESEQSAMLEPYRDLGVLFALRDELFEHILPRIIRQLSFVSPRAISIEEAPPRGRVDWERTLSAIWDERPGQPPLQLHTRQRRRDFATPENLLTIVTLLQYRADVQRLLWGEYAAIGAASLRHPLAEIISRCERELAFPQFAGIRSAAQHILEHDSSAALESQVQDGLIPGGNSAYEELLAWRVRYQSLRLLQNIHNDIVNDVLGVNPARDNYFYQLWLYYALADMLSRLGRLHSWDHENSQLQFDWGTGETKHSYILQHDHAIPDQPKIWQRAPGVRPDLYIAHVQPEELRDNDKAKTLLWREPGYILDAKYYRLHKEKDSSIPRDPIKRMLADLQLTGEQHAALLFAFHGEAPDTDNKPLEHGNLVKPEWPRAQSVLPDSSIMVYRIQPQGANNTEVLDRLLEALLNDVHARLQQRRRPHCHGIFLDSQSLKNAGPLVDHWNHKLDSSTSDLLICPKPHIGAWRVDIVSRSKHCCSNARFCHILGQPDAQKPIRPPRTIEDLLTELEHILSEPNQQDIDEYGEAAAAIAKRIQHLTRSYAEISNVDFEFYYNRLRDLGMAHTLDKLSHIEKESLALSEFLKDQLDRIKAHDFSAPAIHISSVMESEIQKRVYKGVYLTGDIAKHTSQTLGRLPAMKHKDADNWYRIEAHAAAHWHPHPDINEPERRVLFDDFIKKAISHIAPLRNKAAHTDPLTRMEYTKLQGIIFQGGSLGYGALNTLLLCWKEEEAL